jgi:hypothetical protein
MEKSVLADGFVATRARFNYNPHPVGLWTSAGALNLFLRRIIQS